MNPTPNLAPVLVVGDDGTEPSDAAWTWTTSHRWPGWTVEVMTADDTTIEWGHAPEAAEWTPTWDRGTVPDAESVRFIKVKTDPRAMLAERGDASLVVVGLRTHSYFEAMVAGSTTEWLLHHPPTPLVIVNNPTEARSVTVCVDGSAHAQAALEAFASLPLAATSTVTVLSVDDERTDTAGTVEAAMSALEGRVGEVQPLIVEDRPTEAIIRHLDISRPDLVVLGTRGLTGLRRLRLGSTAAAVVRVAPCTSLVASAEAPLA